jgi:hypothetical protein
MRIAIFSGENLLSAKRIEIYDCSASGWIVVSAVELKGFNTSAPQILREQIVSFAEQLSALNCKIIAGADISGIAFGIFDRSGFKIFAIREPSEEIFDAIIDDIENNEASAVIPSPTPLDCVGEYTFDLAALQLSNPEISSKMALQTWLEITPFTLLKLRCNHVPPWIIKTGRYTIAEVPDYENIIVEVRPK